MRGDNRSRTLKLTATWQEGAKKLEVCQRIKEVMLHLCDPRKQFFIEIWWKVKAAEAVEDWRGVLKWEGQMDELLERLPDDTCRTWLLQTLAKAHIASGILSEYSPTASPLSMLVVNQKNFGLQKRLVEILGKMQRFRDQGVAPRHTARKEAAK